MDDSSQNIVMENFYKQVYEREMAPISGSNFEWN